MSRPPIFPFLLLIFLTLAISPLIAAPTNDNWSGAETMTFPFSDNETSVFSATTEANDPGFSCKGGSKGFNTVWYQYTPASNQMIAINTFSSNYDTLLAVFTGTSGAFSEVTCNDNAPSNQQSYLTFSASAGQTYSILVASSFPLGGGETLQVNATSGNVPVNDHISMATPLTMPFTGTVDINFATVSASDPATCLSGTPVASLWYTYTPATYETVTLSFNAESFVPAFAVYMGQPSEEVPSLLHYGCSHNTSLIFKTQPNTTYYIQLVGTVAGSLNLNVSTSTETVYNFNINTTSDTRDLTLGNQQCNDGNGNCSLRAAIMEANALAPAASIIHLPIGTYTINLPGTHEDFAASGDLDILTNITIQGTDRTTTIIHGNQLDRVFDIWQSIAVRITGVTVKGGQFNHNWEGLGGGGAILNQGVLTLDNVVITENTLLNGHGGGIFNWTTLLVSNSVISNNSLSGEGGKDGAGIYSKTFVGMDEAQVLLVNTVVTGNQINDLGTGAGILNYAKMIILGGEISNNRATKNGGGGIYSTGYWTKLYMTDVNISHNHATSYGSGITTESQSFASFTRVNINQNTGGPALAVGFGNVFVHDSTIINNQNITPLAGVGVSTYGNINITNTTISGNHGNVPGGGISVHRAAILKLNNVTIANNQATFGGGIYVAKEETPSTVQISNSIIANNMSGGWGMDCADGTQSSPQSHIQSLGNNIIGNVTGCQTFNAPGDKVNVNAYLSELADNGGSTLTHMPAAISPVIDAGNNAICASTDQRGVLRPFGTSCDIGAVEINEFSPGVFLMPLSINVTEGDTVGSTYVMALTSPPSGNVTVTASTDAQIRIANDGGSARTFDFAFTPQNWNQPKLVNIIAFNDALEEGNHSGTITHSVAAGSASEYLGINISSVTANIIDNDISGVPGVVVMESDNITQVHEGGVTDTYILTLGSKPNADVTITASANAQLQISKNGTNFAATRNFVFTPETWNVAQTVTVAAVVDTIPEGAHTGRVKHTITSTDPTYNGMTAVSVTARVTDNASSDLTLLLPVNNAIISDPKPSFEWTTYLNATSYTLRIRDSFNDTFLNKSFSSAAICSDNTCSFDISVLGLTLDNTETYTWRIKAVGDFGTVTSLDSTFTTDFILPGSFTLISPVDDTVIDDPAPVFSWGMSDNATSYRLRVLNAADEIVINKRFNATSTPSVNDICSNGTCAVDLDALGMSLEHMEGYEWRVLAVNDSGKKKSSLFSFTTNLAPQPFALLSPADTEVVTSMTPVLSWQESAGATKYRLVIRNDSDDTLALRAIITSANCSGGVCVVDTSTLPFIAPLQNNEEYLWFVQARNPYARKRSAKWTFTVNMSR